MTILLSRQSLRTAYRVRRSLIRQSSALGSARFDNGASRGNDGGESTRCRFFTTLPKKEATTSSPLDEYTRLVRAQELVKDDNQFRVAERLDKLHKVLRKYQSQVLNVQDANSQSESGDNPAATESSKAARAEKDEFSPLQLRRHQIPRGIYLWGPVGTGKSILMDLFFACAPIKEKRRVHFHKFMLEVHQRIHDWKKETIRVHGRSRHIDLRPERDAIAQIARDLSKEAKLLCFDEFQVTDVADALIMSKLFGILFDEGTVVVATSNTPAHLLYEEGLNREYFLPFLAQLEAHCAVVAMESEFDHRLNSMKALGRQYMHPLNASTERQIDRCFLEMTDGRSGGEVDIPVMMGRTLKISTAEGGVCKVSFKELCDKPLGAADYKALCENFHTVVLVDIPQMSVKTHNQARRFITLIDELYEHKTRLICSAEVAPGELFDYTYGDDDIRQPLSNKDRGPNDERLPVDPGDPVLSLPPSDSKPLLYGELCSIRELRKAFKRAHSRLVEMGSVQYLQLHINWCKGIYERHGDTILMEKSAESLSKV